MKNMKRAWVLTSAAFLCATTVIMTGCGNGGEEQTAISSKAVESADQTVTEDATQDAASMEVQSDSSLDEQENSEETADMESLRDPSANSGDDDTNAESLISWSDDSEVKAKIVAFVEAATDPDSEGFIPVEHRIVVSDIDGTLIPEKGKKINNDSMTPYSPVECREYLESIKDTSFDDKKGYVYGDMLYAPMREMFDYLYANDFDIYFVSGNYGCLTYAYANYYFGADYLHCVGTEPQWSNEVDEEGNYTVVQNQYDMSDGNWGDMKAYRFWDKVGKIPVLGFGNSDGDVQLLQWTVSNPDYPSMGIMINHDDEREYVYNADSVSGFCTKYGFLDCLISKHFKEIF